MIKDMDEIFDFLKSGKGRDSSFPYQFIAMKDDRLLQCGSGCDFDDELTMLMLYIESIRETFRRHGDKIGLSHCADRKDIWMGFLAALYLSEEAKDISCSNAETECTSMRRPK